MTGLGVFLPTGSNGYIASLASPQFEPDFALNRRVVEIAEQLDFDFALSMVKFRGWGGQTGHWDGALEAFTLMAGLAAVTTKIQLFASAAVLTLPPALAARMAVTIDSIAPGRFGVNIVSGWAEEEYAQMGLWPGEAHNRRRYDYCAEYVTIMRELWTTGHSDFRGDFFQMQDCRLCPLPAGNIAVVGAGQSGTGLRFAAQYCDFNFTSGSDLNNPQSMRPGTTQLAEAAAEIGRDVGALLLVLVIADETDEKAMARWQRYVDHADLDALSWRRGQKTLNKAAGATGGSAAGPVGDAWKLPNSMTRFVGSYASVARMLDEAAALPGVKGLMLSFDDFIEGMQQFGEKVMPLLRCR